MKLYSGSGDEGMTSYIGGRTAKDDPRIEACGMIDELNSFVGLAAGMMENSGFADLREELMQIQHELFDCGSDLAFAADGKRKYKVQDGMVERLEQWIDRHEAACPPLSRFILPGGTQAAAALHVCRTVCRTAERRVVTLNRQQQVPQPVLKYLNRLSDYFFVLARVANVRCGRPDVEYIRGAEVFK